MRIGQKLWIFYWWPIFECVPFFCLRLYFFLGAWKMCHYKDFVFFSGSILPSSCFDWFGHIKTQQQELLLDSMWIFMCFGRPSLPHTLQTDDFLCFTVPSVICSPSVIIFFPFSIIDLTFSSSVWLWRSELDWLGFAIPLQELIRLEVVWFLLVVGSWYLGFSCSPNNSLEVWPVRSFSSISSAIARKGSKSSL